MPRFDRKRLLAAFQDMKRRGEPIVGGGAGTGLSAKCEEAGGIERTLEAARAWEGVEHARAWLQDSLSLTYEARVLRRDGDAGAFAPVDEDFRATALAIAMEASEFERQALRLIGGRLPRRPGEAVVDAMLAERLSFTYVEDATVRPSFAIGVGRVDYLGSPAPTVDGEDGDAGLRREGLGSRPRPCRRPSLRLEPA